MIFILNIFITIFRCELCEKLCALCV